MESNEPNESAKIQSFYDYLDRRKDRILELSESNSELFYMSEEYDRLIEEYERVFERIIFK